MQDSLLEFLGSCLQKPYLLNFIRYWSVQMIIALRVNTVLFQNPAVPCWWWYLAENGLLGQRKLLSVRIMVLKFVKSLTRFFLRNLFWEGKFWQELKENFVKVKIRINYIFIENSGFNENNSKDRWLDPQTSPLLYAVNSVQRRNQEFPLSINFCNFSLVRLSFLSVVTCSL